MHNPDWAIAFQQDNVEHVYFIAETKWLLSSMTLRKIEESKIECARKFFTPKSPWTRSSTTLSIATQS